MKRIKFRAWDTIHKTMCEVETISFVVDAVRLHSETGGQYEVFGEQVILMQYTGLKDKNGIEIYEGDIVENTTQTVYLGDKYEVVWNKNYAGYQLMSNGFTSNIPLIQNFMSYKIIGNIFENPELLND